MGNDQIRVFGRIESSAARAPVAAPPPATAATARLALTSDSMNLAKSPPSRESQWRTEGALMRHLAARLGAVALAGIACLAHAGAARADEDSTPKGILKHDDASKGTTDVATSGFEAAAQREDAETAKDATEAKLSAGGLGAAGNSRSLALTATETFRIRRRSEQLSLSSAVNYAQAGKTNQPTTTSVENLQGKLRYDHFFVGSLAGFVGVSARHDRFQGLDLRLNIDPGFAYYFIDEKDQQLWGELGYDFQYDIRRQSNVDDAAAKGAPIDKTQTQHGGRAFVGYTSKINDHISAATNLEYIQSLEHADHFRVNWDGSLNSSISAAFSIATTLLVQYDNAPLAGIMTTDTTASVSLVYKAL
jgi:putative salt-induced outer membrane protein